MTNKGSSQKGAALHYWKQDEEKTARESFEVLEGNTVETEQLFLVKLERPRRDGSGSSKV